MSGEPHMKALFIGPIDAGKTSLKQRLTEDRIWEDKTGCVIYGEWIDTPGELFENQGFFRRLLQLANQADLVLWVVDATKPMLGNHLEYRRLIETTIIGIATKIDSEEADMLKVSNRMQELGIWRWFPISNITGEGIATLQEELVELEEMIHLERG
jgi:ethanolamine utilization protein EutP (predicted NTPase)